MASINLPATFSKLADAATIPPELNQRIPADWQLSQHQVATYTALTQPRSTTHIVINTALTGDGKSLAGMLAFVLNPLDHATVTLFPTNELIHDQYQSLMATLPQWHTSTNQLGTLSGPRLDEVMNELQLHRSEALRNTLKNKTLLLSNPDILHAILQLRYQQYGSITTRTLETLMSNFRQLTFDEFHTFQSDQICAILVGLILLDTINAPFSTLLLSATPDQAMLTALQRAGFADRMTLINPQQEGWYTYGSAPRYGWRAILQAATLHLRTGKVEDQLDAEIVPIIRAWFAQHRPAARAAIIVNSVAAAHRIAAQLEQALRADKLTVRNNTGLTGSEERRASFTADVLVATATVDVGVDFKINLLIFEAPTAGTFLQRLGRLGRHTSFTDQHGRTHPFGDYAAHALLPDYAYEQLTSSIDGNPPRITAAADLPRDRLAEYINASYITTDPFRNYGKHWGRFQAARIVQELQKGDNRITFSEACTQLKRRYYDLFGVYVNNTLQEAKQHRTDNQGLLIEEAESLRGSSTFMCGVITQNGEVVKYDLLFLLINTHLTWLSRDDFERASGTAAYRTTIADRSIAFFRLHGMRDKPQPLDILLSPMALHQAERQPCRALVLPGIEVAVEGHDFLLELNRLLSRQSVPATLVAGVQLAELYRKAHLPATLRLYPYRRRDADTRSGVIAFGRDALLLDSRLRHHPLCQPNGAIII